MKRPPLTAEQKEEIFRLRGEVGCSYKRIAQLLGIDQGSVSWYCLMEGVERKGRKPGLHKIQPPEAYNCTRNGFPVRGYTKEDDELLLKLEAEQRAAGRVNYSALGRAMNPPRRSNSIRGRLATLARRDERAEGA